MRVTPVGGPPQGTSTYGNQQDDEFPSHPRHRSITARRRSVMPSPSFVEKRSAAILGTVANSE
jgi:hypothetical protein